MGRLQAENDDPEGQPGAVDWDGDRHRGSHTGVDLEAFIAISGRRSIGRAGSPSFALFAKGGSHGSGARSAAYFLNPSGQGRLTPLSLLEV